VGSLSWLLCPKAARVSRLRHRRPAADSSFCSSRRAPTRRTIAASFKKMPTTSGAAFDLADQALQRIGRAGPGPVVGVKGHAGEDIIRGLVHGPGKPGEARAGRRRPDPLPARPSRFSWVNTVRMAARRHGALCRPDTGEQIAQRMDPVALPGGVQDLGHSGPKAFVRVRDHELHATRAARVRRRKIDRGPTPIARSRTARPRRRKPRGRGPRVDRRC
jgi:hypothetical protein